MTKNTDSGKYSYSGYGISFDVNGTFSLSNGGSTSKNVIIFDADMGSSVDVEFSIKKKISILGKGPTQGLDDTTLQSWILY